ncbi:cis-trans isomerase [Seminavis robusta]|uniref:peptidylprolyl isomerase n=1 Tax=Seminavis robusta TaxID=568900 RepID=A0A9N8H998_9STRA|nr:cis-trans isomerase [Seminavis robusta]|eukprot:Sro111_g055350.1 cis-trans isomerase (153) ;mRNA; r:74018-74577
MPSSLVLRTDLGEITLRLLPESAPQTVAYVSKLVDSKIYNGTSFYRSDFVIQFGLHPKKNPHGDMTVNETTYNGVVSNARGTAALAHFDVPDCGSSEVFINLSDNPHLDAAYGGFCVFARVENDPASFATVDAIAAAVKQQGTVGIREIVLQ